MPCFLLLATRTLLEQSFHSMLNWLKLCLKLFATHLFIAQPVPEFEYLINLFQHCFAYPCRIAAPLGYCLKVSLQVRPAYLPPPCLKPVVGPEPISPDDAFSLLAYDLFGMPGCSSFQ